MREQYPLERARNFDEVPYGYTPDDAVEEASRCLQCKKPACREGCPVEIDIPAFIQLITKHDFIGAARKIREKTAFLLFVEGYVHRRFNVKPYVS